MGGGICEANGWVFAGSPEFDIVSVLCLCEWGPICCFIERLLFAPMEGLWDLHWVYRLQYRIDVRDYLVVVRRLQEAYPVDGWEGLQTW